MAHHTPAAFRSNYMKLAQQAMTSLIREFPTPTSCRVTMPGGIPYEAYDSRARVFPWSLWKLLECARSATWYDSSDQSRHFMDMDKLKHLHFTIGMKTDFYPDLYNPDVIKQPVIVDMKMAGLGNKSYVLTAALFFPEQSNPVATGAMKSVFIDPDTFKPGQPPDWWREKYASLMSEDTKKFEFPPLIKPEGTDFVYSESHKVSPWDLDPYVHVNWSKFVKYCMEVYMNWHVKTYGMVGKGDPFRKVKAVQETYKGEATIGDVLDVSFWRDQDNVDRYHFFVEKKHKVIHECSVEFYPQE